MADQDLGDWDEEFLEAAIKEEERHLSSSQLPSSLAPSMMTMPAAVSSALPHSPPPPPPQQQQEILTRSHPLSFSPPRELSQKSGDFSKASLYRSSNGPLDRLSSAFLNLTSNSDAAKRAIPSLMPRYFDDAKDLEIQRLKRELGHVSKQLSELHHAIPSLSDNAKDLENERLKKELGCVSKQLSELEHEVLLRKDSDQKCFKATGVQTDTSTHVDLSRKLLDVWGSSSYQNRGRNLISKLLVACSTDLEILFSHMSTNISSHTVNASEAAKVSHLYFIMTKISNGMIDLKAFFEPLLDLCRVKNASIVHRSLRILHVFLRHLIGLETKSGARNNMMAEELESSDVTHPFHGSEARRPPSSNSKEATCASHNSFWVRFAADLRKRNPCNTEALCRLDWVSLFELVHHIAVRRNEEGIRLEAVSIMTVIVMRSKAYGEREKFGSTEVFESISILLSKESGLNLREEAVRLLYLLLNCPKLSAGINPYCKERLSQSAANDNQENALAFKAFSMILQGLADCMTPCRSNLEDLELCRSVIRVLAFLASSGTLGFEVLISHKPSEDTNFLMLMLQLLVSEIDTEATLYNESAETFGARTLLMRETLILLNRVVSNQSSSPIILRELTKSRDMASLTVDVATRFSRKIKLHQVTDRAARHMRESEITDLARIFKKRVFTYLGDNTP